MPHAAPASSPASARRRFVARLVRSAAWPLALLGAGRRAAAQTDYYNTDAGRPIEVEDAYAVERRAVELQVAPVRLERAPGGRYTWGLEPNVAVGVLPRTQVELGVPLVYVDAGVAGHSAGLAGIDLSVLHNLNVETAIPALGVAADLLLPAGGLGAERTYASARGIVTRSFRRARVHANAAYTFGARPPAGDDGTSGTGRDVVELSRWTAGVAVDHALPLRSLLVAGELVARDPLRAGERVEWHTAAGTRYQLGPRVVADGGAGYRFTGARRGWFVTFGTAVAVGLPWSRR